MDNDTEAWTRDQLSGDRTSDGPATASMSNVVLPQPPDDLSTATIALLADAVGIFAALRGDDGAVIDFEWRLANPAAETLIGHGRLTGRRLRGDDLVPCCAELFAALVAALNGPVTRTLDLQGKGQAVVGRWRLSASPFPGGVCATLADLGPDRPSMAETLATALEHGAESFALFDADDRLIHATGRLKRFLPELADLLVPGVTFEALVRRTAWMDGALSTEAGRERWVEARLANHRHPDKPFTMRGQDGRWIMVREQRLPEGGVLVIHADVTPIKQTEEGIRTREAEARAARREAERASRAKSDFLAHMSHELRTPLNAVLGFSELLMSEAFGPLGNARYRAYANDIHDSGAHLLALIDDILDLSRIEAGRMPLSDENVDVTALSRQALTMLREKAAGKSVTLSTDIAADLPLLLGDQRAVRQMLVNLLSNAVKFTPAGGRAMVTASLMPDGGIGIMVADTGTGIPIDDLDRVLEPFERSDLAIARVTEGTGLGLPIVKRLVELHGGRLELLSEMGVGTSAVLTFPPSRSLPRNLYPPLPHSHRPNLAQPAGRQNASHKADVPKTDVPKTGG